MKQYVVGENPVVDALIGRVDRIEAQQEQAGRELDAVRRTMVNVVRIVEGRGPAGGSSSKGPAGAPQDGQGDDEVPHIDWMAMDDPDAAVEALGSLREWVPGVLMPLTGWSLIPCWPWHPPLLCMLFAIQERYAMCHQAPDPNGLLDLLVRVVPACEERTRHLAYGCNASVHSSERGSTYYEYDPAGVDAMARWWATSRAGDPPGLSVKVQ